MQGTILNGSKNVFEVECEDGIIRDCSIKGKILKTDREYYNPIAPGDVVTVDDKTLEDRKGLILKVEPRKNEFVRWNIKKRMPQLLAANLDYLLIVTTPDEPQFKPHFIDRALAQAEYQGLTPVIVCNKYDLPAAQDDVFQERLAIWEEIGYKVIRSSARSREGIEELAQLIENKLSAFVGQSGVGKSSMINVLDNNVVLKTGSLSQKYGKGCHTTTKGSLIHLQLDEALMGGRKGMVADIIDTPGVKTFLLHDIDADNLALYFREFEPYLGKCEFGMSCSHIVEDNCAIKQAVEDGEISEVRYQSWLKICEELKSGTFEM